MVIWRENLNFFNYLQLCAILSDWDGVSPEIVEFYAENYYLIFTTFSWIFFRMPNLNIIYNQETMIARQNSSHME